LIKIDRENVQAPLILSSEKALAAFELAKQFYATPLNSRLQQRFNLDISIWKDRGVREALNKLFHGKCAYCESKVGITDPGDLDHFRPKGGAFNLDGEFDPDHYWWLAYDWRNFYLTCRICNVNKASKFPVAKRADVPRGERAQLAAPWYEDESKAEGALLLDPCYDTPAEDLFFDPATGLAAGLSKKGKITIEILKLNRESLCEGRRAAIMLAASELHTLLLRFQKRDKPRISPAELQRKLAEMRSPVHPYAGAWRQIINNLLQEETYAGLLNLIVSDTEARAALSEEPAISSTKAQALVKKSLAEQKKTEVVRTDRGKFATQYITRIEIHNFRVIEHLEFDLPAPREDRASWAVLLGENGIGKSSVLKATTLALMDKERIPRLGLKGSNFVRYGQHHGYVKVHVTGYSEPFELRFARGSSRFTKANSNRLQTQLLGYGGTRLLPRAGHEPAPTDGIARVENLFDPFLPLIDAESWLISLDAESFGYSARAIKDLLAREGEDRLLRRSKKVRLKAAPLGGSAPLEELSDGYQSMVALATDIMKFTMKTWHVAEKAQGIVLIDEIDMHLHPRWKMRIISSLRRAFPRVQFIVTTHDPLCLRGTRQGEVYVLRRAPSFTRTASRITTTRADVPPGATADQLLTGFWFGLSSTVDDHTLELLHEHRQFLRKRQTLGNARRRRYLERALKRKLGIFADTSVDRMAESVAAELFEEEDYHLLGPQKRQDMRDDIRRKVSRKLTARK